MRRSNQRPSEAKRDQRYSAQARAAVAAVADGNPERYDREWPAITRRYRLLTASLLGATRLGPMRRALMPTAERLPGVFAAAVNSLARPA